MQSRGGEINHQVVDAVHACSTFEPDLESSQLDDAIINSLSESQTLLSLDVGATRMTGAGLKNICRMKQLEHLDIWLTNISDSELAYLTELPKLKSLSAGGHHGGPNALHADLILPSLRKLKSLEKLWLDGVYCSAEEEQEIRALFPNVRIDRAEEF